MDRGLSTPFALSVHESLYEVAVKETPLPDNANPENPLHRGCGPQSGYATPGVNPQYAVISGSLCGLGKRSRSTLTTGNRVGCRSKKAICQQTPRRTFNPSTPAPKNAFTVALVESRNKRQVGIAILNMRSPELDLYTLADNPTYQSTLRLMHLYDPIEILMPDTTVGSNLHSILNHELQFARITTYQRKYFNEDQGQISVEQKATKESLSLLNFTPSFFLCLAACNCLLKWVAYEQAEVFAPNSLKVTQKTLDGHLALCMGTIKSLEILYNAVDPKLKKGSLLATMNLCKTPLGERLLRSNLMQPLNHMETINERLDSVEELLEQEETFFSLLDALPRFASLDLLNNGLATISNSVNEKSAQHSITNLLHLKQTLKNIPTLLSALHPCHSSLMKNIVDELSDPRREAMIEEVDKVIADEISIVEKMPIHVLHTKLAFALKPGLNGLLDIGRATYCEIIEEIHSQIQSYSDELGLPNLKKHFNATRGFYLSVPVASAENLPNVFIQVTRQGKRVTFSTANLISLDDRRKEALGDVLILTERCLQQISFSVRMNLHWLLNVAENIAMLDLLVNFANIVTQNDSYVRPILTKDGPVAISKGRHPIKEAITTLPFVPNDVYLNETSKLQIITGPNGAGKSTYLRQVGLLVIISHIGAYVPAVYASIPIVDQVFTRMTHGDDLEGNASGFMLECQEAAYIMRHATKSSLVLIDEFGRSTSNVDGVGLAWAAIEELILRQSYTLFTTHFYELTDLPDLYPQVKNIQLKVANADDQMSFYYSVGEGACKEATNHYGIRIAEMAMFPTTLTNFARTLSAQIQRRFSLKSSSCPDTALFYSTIQKLISLRHCTLPRENMVAYLQQIRDEITSNDNEQVQSDHSSDENYLSE